MFNQKPIRKRHRLRDKGTGCAKMLTVFQLLGLQSIESNWTDHFFCIAIGLLEAKSRFKVHIILTKSHRKGICKRQIPSYHTQCISGIKLCDWASLRIIFVSSNPSEKQVWMRTMPSRLGPCQHLNVWKIFFLRLMLRVILWLVITSRDGEFAVFFFSWTTCMSCSVIAV